MSLNCKSESERRQLTIMKKIADVHLPFVVKFHPEHPRTYNYLLLNFDTSQVQE